MKNSLVSLMIIGFIVGIMLGQVYKAVTRPTCTCEMAKNHECVP